MTEDPSNRKLFGNRSEEGKKEEKLYDMLLHLSQSVPPCQTGIESIQSHIISLPPRRAPANLCGLLATVLEVGIRLRPSSKDCQAVVLGLDGVVLGTSC